MNARPHHFEASGLAIVLPPGGRTLVLGASGESLLLADAVMAAGTALGAMTFTGIFVPGLNTRTYVANPDCRVETFFITPELKAAGAAVTFLPLCYADILQHLRSLRIDAALMMVTPPDAQGYCSFGPCVDFLAELWPHIPVRIAHINPLLPRTGGHRGIPFSELTAVIEAPQPMRSMPDGDSDAVADAIGAHIAPLIVDGSTLQTGLGKIPGAVLRLLTGHRGLRICSGLIGDAVADLDAAGALAAGAAVTAGVAIGSQRLYAAISSDVFDFQTVSVTHSAHRIAAITGFVTINSALNVDLFGQAYAEAGPRGWMSGPGGASDYARAAKGAGGLRIIALPASAGGETISRIIAPGAAFGPVSLGRMDIDIVVTEFGVADLRGVSHDQRAARLISIAASEHQSALEAAWQALAARLAGH